MLEILKELRKDVRDVRTVVLQLAEQNRRLERRFNGSPMRRPGPFSESSHGNPTRCAGH